MSRTVALYEHTKPLQTRTSLFLQKHQDGDLNGVPNEERLNLDQPSSESYSVLIWISPALRCSEYYVPAVKRISDAVYLPEDLPW